MSKPLIVKGHIVFTRISKQFEVYSNSFLVAIDGKVQGIYPQLPEEYSAVQYKDYGNKLIIPGFVDLHLHAAQYLQCGAGMTKQLLEWLSDYTFDLEREFNDPDFAKDAYTSFANKLVACGTLRSCIFASSSTKGTDILFEVLQEKGVGAYVGKVNMDRNCPAPVQESTDKSLADTKYLIEKHQNHPFVKPIITPRFAPTCTVELLRGLGELALQYNIPVQSHLSENLDEIKWVKELFNDAKNYSDVYYNNNLYGQTKTVMAHAIYLNDDEKKRALAMKPFLVHCPDSNLNVRSGIMPVREYLDMGLSVGLGSDIAGGHKIGLNEAMVRAIQLSKLVNLQDNKQQPLTMPEAFYLGTKGGGKFFGHTGSFEKGYSFDCLVIEDEPLVAARYSIQDRLEKFIYTGDDRNIVARYVEGNCIDM